MQYLKEGESPSRWLPDDDAFLDIKSVKLAANQSNNNQKEN